MRIEIAGGNKVKSTNSLTSRKLWLYNCKTFSRKNGSQSDRTSLVY